MRPALEVADVIRRHGDAFRSSHRACALAITRDNGHYRVLLRGLFWAVLRLRAGSNRGHATDDPIIQQSLFKGTTSTTRIFSYAEYCLRVAQPIFGKCCSDIPARFACCLMLASLRRYDESESLRYSR